MMFLPILNRTNPYVTAASNLNAPNGFIPIKKVQNTAVMTYNSHRQIDKTIVIELKL